MRRKAARGRQAARWMAMSERCVRVEEKGAQGEGADGAFGRGEKGGGE